MIINDFAVGYENATQTEAGLMSAQDKVKLDGVATGATANIGTITGVTMNGSSKGTSGVVNLGTVLTSHQSIKTINSNSLIGTGDISIPALPSVTTSDNDKILMVRDGSWCAYMMPESGSALFPAYEIKKEATSAGGKIQIKGGGIVLACAFPHSTYHITIPAFTIRAVASSKNYNMTVSAIDQNYGIGTYVLGSNEDTNAVLTVGQYNVAFAYQSAQINCSGSNWTGIVSNTNISIAVSSI